MRVAEHTIEVAGSPVFYRGAARIGVPVLYLHGAPTSADDWTVFLERTGGIAPDLPGFGRSGKAGNLDYSIDGHADFLERFLARMGVRRTTLVAHDWGAAGGLAFAQRHPEAIDRIVLIDPLPLLPDFRWHRLARLIRHPVIGEVLMGSVNRRLLAWALRRDATNPDAWTKARLEAVWEQFDQGTQRAILRLHRSADPERLAAAGAGLAELQAPALVIWGERDPWLAVRFAEDYGALLPHATVERIADAGHWPWLDQPGVIELVVAFLEGGG
ncbi:MAG: alpha/beta fold hydrolase [Solirubrobacteraceae bacterium]